ncbi:hypothetical protein ACS6GG_22330 [Enterobacter bugandensis]|uniref:hypothetical protein n=1 Tax=Enterobacter bugandensis TaxID=881260 RepID=UPI003F426672
MQKQTFSAEALGNEYATGVSRPAVLTTKTFLPHQRVTTEGKTMKSSLLTSEIEKDKANEISEIIFQALQEIDPAEFKDEDSGGPERASGLADQISERLVLKGASIN